MLSTSLTQSIKRRPWDKAAYTMMQICRLHSGFYTLIEAIGHLKSVKQASSDTERQVGKEDFQEFSVKRQ